MRYRFLWDISCLCLIYSVAVRAVLDRKHRCGGWYGIFPISASGVAFCYILVTLLVNIVHIRSIYKLLTSHFQC